MKLGAEDYARIAAAVAAAERTTAGEIRCVLADQRELMPFVLVAGAAALILPGMALIAGVGPDVFTSLTGGWTVIDPTPARALQWYIGLQAAVFAIVAAAGLSPLTRWLTPPALRSALVHRAALAQFMALGLTHTRDRTGVLLFVSLAQRRAEVLADIGIYEKAPTQVWDEVVGLLIAGLKRGDASDGFMQAATRTGEILSAYLPSRTDDSNELPNQVVQVR